MGQRSRTRISTSSCACISRELRAVPDKHVHGTCYNDLANPHHYLLVIRISVAHGQGKTQAADEPP
ncbi:unnamed protein product, partial [Amoebophrya sp. A120]|eukprot:GSA120T00015614001.1